MWKWVIIILLILAAEYLILNQNGKKKTKKDEDTPDPKVDYSSAYKPKYLLTKNEWHEYKKLKEYATGKELQICPKVRLLDIVEPKQGSGYMSLMGKIKSKHVDFLITDTNLHIKAIIELDDSSHDRSDRKERDAFIDQVLTGVGYKVIHTRSITEETLEGL